MFPRIKGLQKPQGLEKFRRSDVKRMPNVAVDNCGDCKQAISLSKGVYCGLLREKTHGDVCRHCPYFDSEPSEYRLFKRT